MGSTPPTLQQLMDLMTANQQLTNNSLEKINLTLEGIKADINQIKSTVAENTARVENMELQLGETSTALYNETEYLLKRISASDQQALSSDIVLKGFPSAAIDCEAIAVKLVSHFGLAGGVRECYHFSRSLGVDKSTNRPKIAHMMAVKLNNNNDRTKIFHKLRDEGHLVLKNLVESCADMEAGTPIYIDNKLTAENLRIKKRLHQLKLAGRIEKFFMKSGLYVVRQPNSSSTATIYSYNQLQFLFPEDERREQPQRQPIRPSTKKRGLETSFHSRSEEDQSNRKKQLTSTSPNTEH